mmetsp:Transcript_76454/g.222043  ORF Transcript_76454/g.222043 Transcript_76454/m.222043 type:complete len:347 (-) Transcript_76454:156-1196(-)
MTPLDDAILEVVSVVVDSDEGADESDELRDLLRMLAEQPAPADESAQIGWLHDGCPRDSEFIDVSDQAKALIRRYEVGENISQSSLPSCCHMLERMLSAGSLPQMGKSDTRDSLPSLTGSLDDLPWMDHPTSTGPAKQFERQNTLRRIQEEANKGCATPTSSASGRGLEMPQGRIESVISLPHFDDLDAEVEDSDVRVDDLGAVVRSDCCLDWDLEEMLNEAEGELDATVRSKSDGVLLGTRRNSLEILLKQVGIEDDRDAECHGAQMTPAPSQCSTVPPPSCSSTCHDQLEVDFSASSREQDDDIRDAKQIADDAYRAWKDRKEDRKQRLDRKGMSYGKFLRVTH